MKGVINIGGKRKWEDTHKIIDDIDNKICSICKIYYPATTEWFYKNKCNGIDGLNPYCKKCTIKKSEKRTASLDRDEYLKSKEKYWRVYHQRPDRIEKRREVMRGFTEKGYLKDWQRKNKDKVKEYNKKRTSKKHEITKAQWEKCKNYFKNQCAYCGMSEADHLMKYRQRLHKEHVDHEGKNDISNCVPSCRKCNSSKGKKPFGAWYSEESLFTNDFSHERLEKIKCWLKDYNDYL